MQLKPVRRRDTTPPWRLRPRDGEPRCFLEQLTQYLWRNRVLYYIALITTVSLVIQIWGPR